MILTQLSVKLADRPGELTRVTDVLGDEGVNIRAFSASVHGDDSQFHMVVDAPAKARSVLEARDLAVTEHPVVAVETPDHPGGLNAVLRPLKGAGVNVTFLYPAIGRHGTNAVLILGADRVEDALAVLRKNYIRVLD